MYVGFYSADRGCQTGKRSPFILKYGFRIENAWEYNVIKLSLQPFCKQYKRHSSLAIHQPGVSIHPFTALHVF